MPRNHCILSILLCVTAFAAHGWPRTVERTRALSNFSIPLLSAAPSLKDFEGMEPLTPLARSMFRTDAFVQRSPYEGAKASQRTEVYVGYTAQNLYVVFLCFDSDPSGIRAHLNRREDINSDDQAGFFLDSFLDRQHAYTFYVNPIGVQQDGTFSEGGEPDLSFDTLWNSEAHRTDRGYVAWFEIPFKSIRFPKAAAQRWGIFFERDIPRNNEAVFFPQISTRQQGLLTQEATMSGIERISPPRNLQFIPYGSFRAFRGLDERDPAAARFSSRTAEVRGGLDAKAVLRDSLVLDLTANPDFSQVESDEPQTTVNQRFEVFFPEKRPFFLENAGYFETPINTVFTRRILDPTFGLRLTGKMGPWAIGTLVTDDRSPGKSVTEADPLSGRRAYYGIVRVSRDLGQSARVGFIYTDRELETVADTACGVTRCLATFNRVGGFDFQFKPGKKWMMRGQALASSTRYSDGTREAGPTYELYAERRDTNADFNTLYQDTAPGFETLTGFFRRPDVRRWSNYGQYRLRPKNDKGLIWHGPSITTINLWDHSGLRIDYYANVNYKFMFKRQTSFGAFGNLGHERLRPSDYASLPANRDYGHHQRGFFFDVGYWDWLSVNAEAYWGTETNYAPRTGAPLPAKANTVEAGFTVRPKSGLTVQNTYLLSRLRDFHTNENIFNAHVIRSKWNYQFTPQLSLRLIGQYDALLGNPSLTALSNSKNVNADVLVTYLVHPGTAIYAGYNSNVSNIHPSLTNTDDGLLRTRNRFINDGRQVFVKVSYLFRY